MTTQDAHELIAPAGALPFPLRARSGPAHVCVVVPVYNEARGIEQLATEVSGVLEQLDVTWSLLFVNDGSNDDTVAVLAAMAARDSHVKYLSLARNFGHQAALSAGLDHAEGDVVVTMDGDLQHPPELLPTLLEAWRRGYDVVHTRKLSTEGLPFWRRIVTSLAYKAIRRVAEVEIIPEASDFRLLDRTALNALTVLPERHRLYRGLTPWIGFRQASVAYEARARAEGESRYGLRQLVQLFARSFFDFSNAPLHVGIVAGVVIVTLCFSYVLYTFIAYLAGHGGPHGYVTLIFFIVLLSSINLTFSGVLGVYLARIYDEVRRRPTYVVGEASSDVGASAATSDELEQVRPL